MLGDKMRSIREFPRKELPLSKSVNGDMTAMDLAVVPSASCIMLAAAPNAIPDQDDQSPSSIHIDAAVRSTLRKLLNQHLAYQWGVGFVGRHGHHRSEHCHTRWRSQGNGAYSRGRLAPA